jgi:hypothetical protein
VCHYFKDDAHAREQMQQHPNIEGLAFAARAFGRRMLEGQFGCPPNPDAMEPSETRAMERYLKQGKRPQPLTAGAYHVLTLIHVFKCLVSAV